ncbi:MAG: hypothetical protein JW976_14315 [Syntrophaceae bacterium]|nr:hypothetical protein [Syntrophaceae bacterium]
MNQKNSFGSNGVLWKFILVMVMLCFAIPLSAAEKAKIKLPDGLYMYDAPGVSIRFQKFFIVHNNIIYSSQDALKKFGVSKLNKLFTEKKKFKILLGGEKIGEIYNVKIGKLNNELDWTYEEELSAKDINQGSAYGRESISIKGSAVRCLAVPETYKEVKKKVYTTLPREEVDKIAKLAKAKLYLMVEDRTKTQKMSLYEDNLELLDKISDHNGELYLGIYNFSFKKPWNKRQWSYWDDKMIFSAKNHNVHFITGEQDEDYMTICGMLDVDSDGEDELIIERSSGGLDVSTTTLEMHKQKEDGNWKMIKKISWEVQL